MSKLSRKDGKQEGPLPPRNRLAHLTFSKQHFLNSQGQGPLLLARAPADWEFGKQEVREATLQAGRTRAVDAVRSSVSQLPGSFEVPDPQGLSSR